MMQEIKGGREEADPAMNLGTALGGEANVLHILSSGAAWTLLAPARVWMCPHALVTSNRVVDSQNNP